MITLTVINLLLGFFDNKLFFDEDYIKFLKYKNSIIKTEIVKPIVNFEFYKRLHKEEKKDKINLFTFTLEKPKPFIPSTQFESNSVHGKNVINLNGINRKTILGLY